MANGGFRIANDEFGMVKPRSGAPYAIHHSKFAILPHLWSNPFRRPAGQANGVGDGHRASPPDLWETNAEVIDRDPGHVGIALIDIADRITAAHRAQGTVTFRGYNGAHPEEVGEIARARRILAELAGGAREPHVASAHLFTFVGRQLRAYPRAERTGTIEQINQPQEIGGADPVGMVDVAAILAPRRRAGLIQAAIDEYLNIAGVRDRVPAGIGRV